MRSEITYKSQDNITDIHAIIWTPTLPVKAIVQISHGMVEHIERYENIALELNKYGILVCGNDDLGHGKSIVDKNHYGYFAAKNASQILIDDTHTLTNKIKEQYPNIPYYIMGHSMGSFIVRSYIQNNSDELSGAIIIGSTHKSGLTMVLAKFLTAIIAFYHHGYFYRSKFLEKITIGNLNKHFEEGKENPRCWISSDETIIKAYQNDPLMNFRFTCNAYDALFTLIKRAGTKKYNKNIRQNLPLLIMSGKDDPIGNFGKSIYKLESLYKMVGIKNIKIKLYNGMRHEILNENEKIFVINDIMQFINTVKENH